MVEYTAFSALYSWETPSDAHRQWPRRYNNCCILYRQESICAIHTILCEHAPFTCPNMKDIYIVRIYIRQNTLPSYHHTMSFNEYPAEQNILVPDTVCYSSTILDVKVTCREYTCDRLSQLPTGLREAWYLHVGQSVSNLAHDAKRMITWLEGVAAGDIEPSVTPPAELAITHTNEAVTRSYTDAERIIRRIDALERLVRELRVPSVIHLFQFYKICSHTILSRPRLGPTALIRWIWALSQGQSIAPPQHPQRMNRPHTTTLEDGTWNKQGPAEDAGSITLDTPVVELCMTPI